MSKTNTDPTQGVSCMVIQDQRIIFEIRAANCDGAGKLDFCSGHIEPGESPYTAMRRELQQELDIPHNLSANIQELDAHHIFLKSHKEQYWYATFYYLEVPSDFNFVLQESEVAAIKKVPFRQGITLVQNDRTRYPYNQIESFVKKATKVFYHNHGRI